jgi:hypothetical protein
MAEECGFFNAEIGESGDYDRVYLAQTFAKYFASFIGNGVFVKYANKLQVISTDIPSMAVQVSSGQGFCNGYWYENTDTKRLTVEVADGLLSRKDIVVLRWGASERAMWVDIVKGEPSSAPKKPEIKRTQDYYDLQLAVIDIPAGALAINQENINDTRPDSSVCGWVSGVVDQIDTTNLFAQFQNAFDIWFEQMKGQLSTDAAGNLQTQIDNIMTFLPDVPNDDFIAFITAK